MSDKWLGDGSPFGEHFPSCGLNEAQVRTLVSFSGVRVVGLAPSPAIRKLSESGIVEIGASWSTSRDDRHGGVGGKLWLEADGTYIAAAIWEGSNSDARGPIKVYRWSYGRKEARWRLGENAEEVSYDRADSHIGAYEQTRTFIKNEYVNREDN
jgi:hypothetical protein